MNQPELDNMKENYQHINNDWLAIRDERDRLKVQLEECDAHLRRVLLGAAKVSRPSYNDKPAFDRFQNWRDECKQAEIWRSFR